ncbi:MAG: tripartite tricarboxylate transporter substrate binding protein [Streptosporangiales bacterium]|nr:tripartite tricarboxylate transporter substrate binding protein [Streptosporangiales bacterium]
MRQDNSRRFFARRVGALAAAVAVTTLSGCSGGSGDGGGGGDWAPTQDVTMVVPFAPGGGSDIFGRAVQGGIEKVEPDVNVQVENRDGGSGAVGYSYFLSKRGDPHYLLPSETTGVALPLVTKTPWKWTDFTPIMQIAQDVSLLFVPKDSPYKDLDSAIAAAKKEKLRVGIAGTTSPDGVNTSLIERDQDVKFNRVVFDSGGEMSASLLGGDIDIGILNPSEIIGQLKAGKVRALAAFADERYERAPLDEIPTAKEQGVDAAFTQYRGVFATGDITEEQRAYWESTIVKWTKSAHYEKYVESNHLDPQQRKGKEFEKFLRAYQKELEPIVEKG